MTIFIIIILGHTTDYAEMIKNLVKRYPTTKIVAIGFSLGGNLITKYLGETEIRKPDNIIGKIWCRWWISRIIDFSSLTCRWCLDMPRL